MFLIDKWMDMMTDYPVVFCGTLLIIAGVIVIIIFNIVKFIIKMGKNLSTLAQMKEENKQNKKNP